jgi:hypothetical protein
MSAKPRKLIALLGLVAVLALGALGLHAPSAGACGLVIANFRFEGTVRSVDGSVVTYDVERLDGTLLPGSTPPAPGTEYAVTYGPEDVAELEVGRGYLVDVWFDQVTSVGPARSAISRPRGEGCEPLAGTVHADGSLIDEPGFNWRPWGDELFVVGLVLFLVLPLSVAVLRSGREPRVAPRVNEPV